MPHQTSHLGGSGKFEEDERLGYVRRNAQVGYMYCAKPIGAKRIPWTWLSVINCGDNTNQVPLFKPHLAFRYFT